MSHVEQAEAAGSSLGLVAVVLALLLICALTVALVHFHRQGMARVRADRGGRLRLSSRWQWLVPRSTFAPCDRTCARLNYTPPIIRPYPGAVPYSRQERP